MATDSILTVGAFFRSPPKTSSTGSRPKKRTRQLKSPDFVSDWRHLLKVPVLVQIQAKPPPGPNKDFVFNGMGEIPRDDDIEEPYGAFPYLNDKEYVLVPHGLGVVPVLVQVAAKPPSGPNKDFVFNGIGEIPRDDDFDEPYGAVSYLYDKEFVLVTTMSRGNDHPGKAILTSSGFICYYDKSFEQGILMYGFNETTFRIWTEIQLLNSHCKDSNGP
ncbi:hypothetical protein DPMN_005487 [Dreissena polymorpha]|uniref:Uncharacterized protein n=1 Tax=Dreissena polymorpha TaxID=45954 RepID=A0A9D4MTK8_DREPO|nr:hypothetical protein DPMN_005487 [Dreissena polymorpha]